ncbi:hypothetical protein GK047_07705 [Paenibacillus sp. SYP-B3998]|uniref:Uncharacterized protein n=1 Tax=Paenibacillus sp. SYP-B3998 TaxID=2678564 RepID=A0A6G3ZWV8_9BACL|nr:hypothetical protein [Paenibacillus sp. SYP-B3998]NEW05897.1 hypothetical protein [Paenibacillus sp. SYP-B3998]
MSFYETYRILNQMDFNETFRQVKMSAGSSTVVGGYSGFEEGIPQFETADERSVEQIRSHLHSEGYQWL